MFLGKPQVLAGFKGCFTPTQPYAAVSRRAYALPSSTPVKFVPQQQQWILERMGSFHRILEPGLNVIVPFIDRISYTHSLKEVTVNVPPQSAITSDNVSLLIDGVLYYKVTDAYKASYGIDDPEFAILQLAQTTMRAAIGTLSLDRTLQERQGLNTIIVAAINDAARAWGLVCMRYEIRDIQPPESVLVAMHRQAAAERQKRADVLESEGKAQAGVNIARGNKEATILESEASMRRLENIAHGESSAIRAVAQASADRISTLKGVVDTVSGDAVRMLLSEQYIQAFAGVAKAGNTVVVPVDLAGVSGALAQVLAQAKSQ